MTTSTISPDAAPPEIAPPDVAPRLRRWSIVVLWIAGAVAIVLGLLVLALGAFPVGLARGLIERRLSHALHTQVHVGSVTRDTAFSYTPIVSVRDVAIAQPAWVGKGDFVRVASASVHVPVFALLFGSFRPDRVAVDGARIALVRDASGRANWKPDGSQPKDAQGSGPSLSDLSVTNTQIVLRDAKRGLIVAGPLSVDAADGLRLSAAGTFHDTPVKIALTGGRITGIDPAARYPFAATFVSPALTLRAKGTMDGVLDTRHFKADIATQAPSLKNVDDVIEAGLFGTQPIDLHGTIRHDGRDWYVDRLAGSMGRSRFSGSASVKKQDVRTVIDARVHATQFDFDDLADDAGQAASNRRRAALGPRVIPTTRIVLSKLWKTDGTVRFAADRLLSKDDSVFRSLAGTLKLDHRVATVTGIAVGLANGQMSGEVRIDHRSGLPKFSLDLRLSGLTLEALVGKPDMIGGRVRGRIVLAGRGETIRTALAHANGKAAIVATQGSVRRTIADVLGQNLSGAVSHAISAPSTTVPLQCFIADFRATGGVLRPHPLVVDTAVSLGRGSGRIVLDGERIDLTLAGASKSHALLRIADPIRVGGTLSRPSVSVAGLGAAEKPSAGSVLKVLGRSLGQALGLSKTPASAEGRPPGTINCAAAVATALR